MSRGWLNLHGHSHGRLTLLPRQTDVDVDAWGVRPETLEQITAAKRPRAKAVPLRQSQGGPGTILTQPLLQHQFAPVWAGLVLVKVAWSASSTKVRYEVSSSLLASASDILRRCRIIHP
jgi:hypothetical protein